MDRRTQFHKPLQQALEDLCQFSGADNVTCHSSNRVSGNLWLIAKAGVFRNVYALHGPLTLGRQKDRMEKDQNPIQTIDPQTTFDHFQQLTENLSANVLAGPSFVVREGITHCIRIRMKDVGRSGVSVVIFLNYQSGVRLPPQPLALEIVNRHVKLLRLLLTPLVLEPRLDQVSALELRSVVALLQREIAQPLEKPSSLDELYARITEKTFELIKPQVEGARNVICTLHKVNVSNQVELLASCPQKPVSTGGIVEHVAHSGQFYLVNNINEYKLQESGPYFPKYAEFHPHSKSGMACPLIVQNRVIGVLDLEADAKDAFGESEVLMLWQLASVAAIGVRQGALWETSTEALDLQRRQLDCETEPEIFLKTIEYVQKIGYQASIWDLKHAKWHGGREFDTPPRATGYTQEAVRARAPIVLADLRPDPADPENIETKAYRGELNERSTLFTAWEQTAIPLIPLSEGNKRHVLSLLQNASPWDVVTDIALPIFSDPNSTSSEIIAVMWATTRRHFQSLLDDEVWRLSLISRGTSVSLKVWQQKKERLDLVGQTRTFMLNYHFGQRAPAIAARLDREPALLAPAKTDAAIVLNIDIKGSTVFAQKAVEKGELANYVRFISEYQEQARAGAGLNDGVFDKTMGDGVQILFNVDPLSRDSATLDDVIDRQKQLAVRCAFGIFEAFRELVDRYFHRERCFTFPARNLSLSAGLAIGKGLVGSFEKGPFDFTVLGDVANRAGKLMPMARAEPLLTDLAKHRSSWQKIQSDSLRPVPLDEAMYEDLARRLTVPAASFLVCDWDFVSVVPSSEYDVFQMPEMANRDPALILPKRLSRV
jgi:class 3 adenylate cyclase/GAF domain-containing protein